MAPLAQRELHQLCRDLLALRDLVEQRVYRVCKAMRVQRVQPDHRVSKDLPDQLERQALQAQLRQFLAPQAPQVLSEQLAPKGHRVFKDLWGPLELKEIKVLLAQLDRLELLGQHQLCRALQAPRVLSAQPERRVCREFRAL